MKKLLSLALLFALPVTLTACNKDTSLEDRIKELEDTYAKDKEALEKRINDLESIIDSQVKLIETLQKAGIDTTNDVERLKGIITSLTNSLNELDASNTELRVKLQEALDRILVLEKEVFAGEVTVKTFDSFGDMHENKRVLYKENMTFVDILKANFDVTISYGMLYRIGKLSATKYQCEYLAFYVNGKFSDVGIAEYKHKDGDLVEFKHDYYNSCITPSRGVYKKFSELSSTTANPVLVTIKEDSEGIYLLDSYGQTTRDLNATLLIDLSARGLGVNTTVELKLYGYELDTTTPTISFLEKTNYVDGKLTTEAVLGTDYFLFTANAKITVSSIVFDTEKSMYKVSNVTNPANYFKYTVYFPELNVESEENLAKLMAFETITTGSRVAMISFVIEKDANGNAVYNSYLKDGNLQIRMWDMIW